jgi:protein tyrosine kinase modulator
VELRSYGTILWRRLWIIVLVFGVVVLYAAYHYYTLQQTPGALKAYQTDVVIRIGLQATPSSSDQYYTDYQATSEALADEFVTGPVLSSKEFGSQVQKQVQATAGDSVNLGPIQDSAMISSALSATHTHALVTISVLWSTPDGAKAIANAVGEVCRTQIDSYLDYEVRTMPGATSDAHPQVGAQVISISDPVLVAGPSAHEPILLLVLLLLALIIGIALAFLIEYLDDRIRSREEVIQLLQLPVYGEIPRARMDKEIKRQI